MILPNWPRAATRSAIHDAEDVLASLQGMPANMALDKEAVSMKDVANVTTYLQKHGPALAGRICERFRPLVTAPQLDVRRLLARLKRKPPRAQTAEERPQSALL